MACDVSPVAMFRANRNNQKDFQQPSPVICQLCWWCIISSHQKKTLWCFSWAVVPSVDEILAVTTLRKHDLLWRVSPTFSQTPAESCQQEERPHKTGLSENCVGQAFLDTHVSLAPTHLRCPLVILLNFHSISVSGCSTWKVEERGPQLFFNFGSG